MQRIVAVIVHYGSADLTRRCLRSLTDSNPPPEIVVVDHQGDAADWLPSEYPQSRLLEPGENLGFGRGVNRGIAWALAQSRFDAVLLLNNDATVAPEAIGLLASALEASADRALAAPRILLQTDPPTLWYGGGEVDWWRGSARVPGAGGPGNTAEALADRDIGFASGCAMLLRLEALTRVGGFDPRFFLYEEDVELGLRLQAAGWRSRYVAGAVVHHYGQGSQRHGDEPFQPLQDPHNPRWRQLVELQVRNRLLAMTRHAHGTQRLRFRLAFPLYWGARCLRYIAAGRFGAPLAVLRGWIGYRRLRRTPFVDELAADRDTA